MALELFREHGTPVDRQRVTWRDLAPPPISKLDDDAFTRVRVIVAAGMEAEAVRASHARARSFPRLGRAAAVIRRLEQHQHTQVAWLLGADHAPLELAIAHAQAAIEVGAAIAQDEPDPYLAANHRLALAEHVDALYRLAALDDRLLGQDANAILQGYTDIRPGRPTALGHRHPLDDLRAPYDAEAAPLVTKLHARVIVALEAQVHANLMAIGPMFADPSARALCGELASIEEQHVTQAASLVDPREHPLEAWLLDEAAEAFVYWSCAVTEDDARLRRIWEHLLDDELGHLHAVAELYEDALGRDPRALVGAPIHEPIAFESHRGFVRRVLAAESELAAAGPELVPRAHEPERTRRYRAMLDRPDAPAHVVAGGWRWRRGTELAEEGSR